MTGSSHHAFTFATWVEDRGEGEADHDEGGDLPVVADDEVVPERAERLELLHEPTTSDCCGGRAKRGPAGFAGAQPEDAGGADERHHRDEDEQGGVVARPGDARALRAPERTEAGEHDAHRELHPVLRDLGERGLDRDAGDGDDDDRGGGADDGGTDVLLVGRRR